MQRAAIILLYLAGMLLTIGATKPRQTNTQFTSPDGSVQFRAGTPDGQLSYSIIARGKPVIELSPMRFTLDGVDLTKSVRLGRLELYQLDETYPCYGAHSQATNRCHGAIIDLQAPGSNKVGQLEIRLFDDGAAFRFLVASNSPNARVPDEATDFTLPQGSTVWFHDLEGHYEGVHTHKDISEIQPEQWAAPPVTFKLPGSQGYASITEAALINYSGMALQATGERALRVRLGHSHPPSHPYRLRYSAEDIARLSKPAAISGAITTPWRVIIIARDLNQLVNSDIVPNLCPPPDPLLFPEGARTPWIKPGRAVWKYLDGGGSNSLSTMKEFTRLAAELGFEHHIIEGFWSRWSDQEIQDLVSDADAKHVGIWFWKHSRSLRDPQARHDFLERCHHLGIAGAKIDFFDHEAKEVIDLYQALLKEAAAFHLLLDFHGANKPTGESRTWPNELTREAVRGMEASRLTNRATPGVTLPFTRWLAGPAEYTPLVFGERRQNTTWAHQIASAAILSAPLLTYGAHPSTLLTNPCVNLIKSIPSIWDETAVLPPSEIGEIAVFARRSTNTWFLAVMNGTTARKIQVPLRFLPEGEFEASFVRDLPDRTASQIDPGLTMRSAHSLTIELQSGGGFIGRFQKR